MPSKNQKSESFAVCEAKMNRKKPVFTQHNLLLKEQGAAGK